MLERTLRLSELVPESSYAEADHLQDDDHADHNEPQVDIEPDAVQAGDLEGEADHVKGDAEDVEPQVEHGEQPAVHAAMAEASPANSDAPASGLM